jgi:2-polyprenyl-3-methyl-5-hydroxy-6-metoxy-1,4-benzoquinol methylase
MVKKLVLDGLRRLGYRLVPVPRDHSRPHARFNRQTFEQSVTRALAIANELDPTGEFTRIVKKYMHPKRASFYYEILEVMEGADVIFEGRTILDMGSFLGDMLRAMYEHHPQGEYFGMEPYAEAVILSRELCPFATIRHSGIEDLGDEEYDVVLLLEVMEHLVHPEDALRCLWSHTRNHLVLTVPNGRYDTFSANQYNEERGSYSGHVNFWSPENWPLWLRRELPDAQVRTGELPTGQLYAVISARSPQ